MLPLARSALPGPSCSPVLPWLLLLQASTTLPFLEAALPLRRGRVWGEPRRGLQRPLRRAQSCFAFSSDSLHPAEGQVCLSALVSRPGTSVRQNATRVTQAPRTQHPVGLSSKRLAEPASPFSAPSASSSPWVCSPAPAKDGQELILPQPRHGFDWTCSRKTCCRAAWACWSQSACCCTCRVGS